MSLRDFRFTQIAGFKGAWTSPEASDVPPDRALVANNCEFRAGQVRPRGGFTTFWNNNEPVTTLANWIKPGDSVSVAGNYLIYFNPTSAKARLIWNLTTPAGNNADLYLATGGYSLSVAQLGNRAYLAAFNSSQQGATECRVVSILGGVIQVDKCFLGPLTTKPVIAEGGVGNVTAGLHRIGYMIQTRNGFRGKISPSIGGLFDTTSVITSTGDKTITFDLTATWPVEANLVYPVMTPSTDLNSFYIPPQLVDGVSVPGGQTYALPTQTFDISDDDLVATGINVTENFNLLTQDGSGNGPFSPYFVFEYGSRMGYMTILGGVPTIFISDPYKPQQISLDQHMLKLPGDRLCLTAFSDRGVLYVVGPHWTYAFVDNNQVPVQWPEPQRIDAQIGTLAIRGVSVNQSKGIAWVADRGGLYLFSGQYAERPVSEHNQDYWDRINWAAAHVLEVVDHPAAQHVIVKCALDDSTVANALLVWDYQNGYGADEVSFTYWDLTGVSLGALAVVQNDTTKQLELWLGKATAGAILRQPGRDGQATADDAGKIEWVYRTAHQPGIANAPMGSLYAHHGEHIRCSGQGSLKVSAMGIDGGNPRDLPTIFLEESPDRYHLIRTHYIGEGVSLEFSLEGSGDTCVLSGLKHYYTEKAGLR